MHRNEPCVLLVCDKRDAVLARALVLHGDDDAGVTPDIEVSNRQSAKPLTEGGKAHQSSIGGVQHRKRRGHGVQVQLRTTGVGMGADAAVSYREPRPAPEHADLVRTHAAARPLADPPPTLRDTPHPDDAFAVLETVLRGEEEGPVGTECAVPVEMPARARVELLQHRAGRRVHDECPIAGTPGEHHDASGGRLNGEAVAAARERYVVTNATGLVENRGEISTLPIHPTSDKTPV